MRAGLDTIERAATRRRVTGFTLVEMVTSLAILSILVVAMGSAMVITARSIDTETGATAGVLAGREVVDELTADLRFAQGFTTRTDTKLVFTVPDRDGDLLAETISYVWHGVPGGAPGAVVRQYNGGAEVTLAENVSDFSLNWLYREVAVPVDLATGGGPALPTVLLVVAKPASLLPDEIARESLLRAWGFDVVAIDDEATEADYVAAMADAQLIYLPSHIDFAGAARDAVSTGYVGVVVESASSAQVLGLISGSISEIQTDNVTVIENGHEITACLDASSHAIVTSYQPLNQFAGDTGAGVVLAQSGGAPALVAFESGTPRLSGGGNIAARRVVTPWGRAAFDFDSLNAKGHLILYRSLHWVMQGGAAAPADPGVVLLVVVDPTSLTAQESLRKTRIESWGHVVNVIDESDSQADFDTAIAAADSIYVSEEVNASNVGTKLTAASIGIVNEEPELHDELGIASDKTWPFMADVTITDNSHPVTAGFSTGPATISSSDQSMTSVQGTLAPGLQVLGAWGADATIAVLDTGAELYGGGSAAGRRVQLPWGGGSFDFSRLTTGGLKLVRQAIEWAEARVEAERPGIFGYETVFSTPVSGVKRIQIATEATLSESGRVTSISAYVYDNKDIRVAIYADDGGEPGALLVESETVKAQDDPTWNIVDVPATPLSAGTYWLALAFKEDAQQYYQDSGGQTRYRKQNAVEDGFLADWGTSDDSFSIKVSIHATYTPD